MLSNIFGTNFGTKLEHTFCIFPKCIYRIIINNNKTYINTEKNVPTLFQSLFQKCLVKYIRDFLFLLINGK